MKELNSNHKPEDLKEIEIKLENGTKLVVFCVDCEKILYQSGVDNYVTRIVARSSFFDHLDFFTSKHEVIIVYR